MTRTARELPYYLSSSDFGDSIDRQHADRQMSAKEWDAHVAKWQADRAEWERKFCKPRKVQT